MVPSTVTEDDASERVAARFKATTGSESLLECDAEQALALIVNSASMTTFGVNLTYTYRQWPAHA